MEKDYAYLVEVKWVGSMPARNREDAIDKIKQTYVDEYNLDLTDEEIKLEGGEDNEKCKSRIKRFSLQRTWRRVLQSCASKSYK